MGEDSLTLVPGRVLRNFRKMMRLMRPVVTAEEFKRRYYSGINILMDEFGISDVRIIEFQIRAHRN